MYSTLEWLQQWYTKQCDGDWEHNENIKIRTIDNPGWRVTINLKGTNLEEKPFTSLKIERSEVDWVHCFIRDQKFQGACGPENLIETLQTFIKWADAIDE